MEKNFLEDTFLKDRYKYPDELTGDKDVNKPSMIKFINSDAACDMLYNTIWNNIPIVMHGDVDMDGLYTTRLLSSFTQKLKPNYDIKLCINKLKTHGINQDHVEYFNKKGNCLVVILDSGSNNIEFIKQIKHNVLVIDHHDLEHSELTGKTANGDYVIVSNMANYEDYQVNSNMSAGLVTYELLRYMQDKFKFPDILEDNKLYQLVAVTLFTDIVNNDEPRNIYYIDKATGGLNLESGLDITKNILNSYGVFDKSFISYTLAPTFNRAIRAGFSGKALDIAVKNPKDIVDILYLKELESKLLENYTFDAVDLGGCMVKDVTQGVGRNYSGLMANKLLDHFKESSLCYIVNDGVAEGSFRGKYSDIDYRKLISGLDYFAQGHSLAFGYQIPLPDLGDIVKMIVEEESTREHREYLTAGDSIPKEHRGIYHMSNADWIKFRQLGYAWKIGILNSRIANNSHCINIVVSRKDIEVTAEYSKMKEYSCLGIKGCKGFEELESEYLYLYIENSNELNFYLRNKWF